MEPLSHHLEALRRDPASETAAAKVRKEARAQGDLRSYVEAFHMRATQLAARDMHQSAAVAYLEAAMVAEELQDWMLAADLFRLSFTADPTKRDPLVLLGRALTRAGQPRELVPILRDMLRASPSAAAKAEIHLQLADFLATELRDSSAAIEEIRAALETDPQNPVSSTRAKEILTAHGLTQAFEAHTRPSAPPRPSAAPPARPSAAPPAPRLSVQPPAGAFPGLPPAAPPTPTPVRLSASVPLQPTPTPGPSLPVSPQAARFRASLQPQPTPSKPPEKTSKPVSKPAPQGPPDENLKAIQALSGTLAANPADIGVIDELMRLGQLVEDPSPVIAAYESAVRALSDASLRSYVRVRLGMLYNRSLDRPEEAVRVFAAILDDDPRNGEARRMLVAREGADDEGRSQDEENRLIADLAKAAAAAAPAELPGLPPPPKPLEIAAKIELPPLRTSLPPTPTPYSQPPVPAPPPGLSGAQKAGAGVLAAGVALGAYLTLSDALWPELTIGSRPPGAAIVIDGETRAETTPATIRVAPNEPHRVELRFAGAHPKTAIDAITLSYRATSSTVAVLKATPRIARISPVGARVEMNSRHVGNGTEVTLEDFSLEEPVHIRVTADGHIPAQRSFEAGHQVPPEVSFVLTPLPPK